MHARKFYQNFFYIVALFQENLLLPPEECKMKFGPYPRVTTTKFINHDLLKWLSEAGSIFNRLG